MKTVFLEIDPGNLPRFTTLLQGGFYLDVRQGIGLGDLLSGLPGFTEEYVKSRVETIFLDGLPADNLNRQLYGEEMVIALSAAMPGLAGAIFRKGSTHASLRTETATQALQAEEESQSIRIRVKLFNVIAVERGAQILSHGCEIRAKHLAQFLAYRDTLLSEIRSIEIEDSYCDQQSFLSLLQREETISLNIRELP